jgi:TPR repeat protein
LASLNRRNTLNGNLLCATLVTLTIATAASAQQSGRASNGDQLQRECLASYRANMIVPSGTTPAELERMPRLVQAFQLCQQASGQGNKEASKGLGVMYFLGLGVQRNKPQAVKYLTPFTHTDRQVTYYMAELYEQGFVDGNRNTQTARQLFLESCQKAYAPACKALGTIYEFGQGVPRDRPTAILYYSHAGTLGDAYAGQAARVLARPGTPVFRNEEALGEYVGRVIGPDVISGNEPDSRIPASVPGAKLPPPANFNPTTAATSGSAEGLWQACRQKYLNLDHKGAAELCLRAAEAGSPIAMYQIGYDYENGDGVPRDLNQAVQWWSRGAAKGSSMAQKALGDAYEQGNGGLPQDWVMAAGWWRKSAEQGLAKGEFELGRAYRFGIGVPCNLETAVAWYEKSVQQGGPGQSEVQWLRGNRFRFDGQFINGHEAAFFHGVWQGNMTVPFGRLFHNQAERDAYLHGAANYAQSVNAEGRRLEYNRKKHEYDDCVRQNGSTACGAAPIGLQ